MSDKLMDVIEEITDMIENDELEVYFYQNNKFHIIDESRRLDIEIKFSKNFYLIKDNINNNLYYTTKRYLDEETTARKLLIDNGTEQFYYSFLEKDSYTKIVRLIRKCGKEYLICTNTETINKTDNELIEYASNELDKDIAEEEELEDDEGYILEEDDINGEELKEISETFEEQTISEYEKYIKEKVKTSQEQKYENENDDVDLLLEFYDSMDIVVNGEKIEGREKILIAQDCDKLTEEKFLSSLISNAHLNNLKIVIETKNHLLEDTQENER